MAVNPGRILIATPTLSQSVCSQYVVSLSATMNLLTQYGVVADLELIGGDHFISKARNVLLQRALDKGYGTVFFVDSDQGWDAEGFIRVLFHDPPIVAGVPPKKIDDPTRSFEHLLLDSDTGGKVHVEGGLLRALRVGAGFLRIRRDALEILAAAYPEKVEPGDGSGLDSVHWLFDAGPINGHFWGEDLSFCLKWREQGGYIWIDPNINFTHSGIKHWEGNLLTYLQAYCEVTLNGCTNFE